MRKQLLLLCFKRIPFANQSQDGKNLFRAGWIAWITSIPPADADPNSKHNILKAHWIVAAKCCHMNLLKFLHANDITECTQRVMDYAASEGHMDVVEWLHRNRQEGCSTCAWAWAAKRNHLPVLKFLGNHYPGKQTTTAIDFAARNGRLDIAEWLRDKLGCIRRTSTRG